MRKRGDLAETIGERIAELRESRKMTQQALALAAGATQASISRWESGKGEPCASELLGLSTALRVNAHYLVTGQGREELPGVEETRSYSAGVRRVIARLRATLNEIETTSVSESSEEKRRERAARVASRSQQVQADIERSGQRPPQAQRKKGRG